MPCPRSPCGTPGPGSGPTCAERSRRGRRWPCATWGSRRSPRARSRASSAVHDHRLGAWSGQERPDSRRTGDHTVRRPIRAGWHARRVVTRFVDAAERRTRLAVRHRHVPVTHTDDVVALTDGLVALHSTDPVSVYLSAAARMATPSLSAVDAALYDERSLVRHHAMRRTLWVFGHEAARLAHHAATVDVARAQRRLTHTMFADGG